MVNLFDQTIQQLERSLNYSTEKNRTISQNIANVDTPNFKAQDTVFKNVFNDALHNSFETKRTHKNHFTFYNQGNSIQTITKKNSMYNHNGNNVDIDKEMTELAKNQIYYQSLIDRLNGKFNSIQTVLRGGS